MELKEIPAVKIETVDDGKYLVAEVVDSGGNIKIVVRGANYGVNHPQIAQYLKEEIGDELKVKRYLGGGKIWMQREGNTIHLFDTSGDFGPDQDRKRTIALIQEAFPGQIVSEL